MIKLQQCFEPLRDKIITRNVAVMNKIEKKCNVLIDTKQEKMSFHSVFLKLLTTIYSKQVTQFSITSLQSSKQIKKRLN